MNDADIQNTEPATAAAAEFLIDVACLDDGENQQRKAVTPAELVSLAAAYARAEQFTDAEALYRQVIDPLAAVLIGYGRYLSSRQKHTEALAVLMATTALDPTDANRRLALGEAVLEAGHTDEAEAVARAVLVLAPALATAHLLLGWALASSDRLGEATTSFARATELDPQNHDAWNGLGVAYARRFRLTDALAAYRRALALQPRAVGTWSNLGKALADQGDSGAALVAVREALRLRPEASFAAANELFFLNDDPDATAADVFAAHQACGARLAAQYATSRRPHTNDRDPERPLRVGYVSPDLRAHPVAFFLAPILATHTRRAVEAWCYSSQPRADAVTASLRGLAVGWREIAGRSDDDVAAMIRADGIDVLVDLAGHSAGNRLGVFARAPAPVQVTYLGYANTTGLPAINYRVTDRWADPPGMTESLHTEKLVRPFDSFLCYSAIDDAPPTTRLAGTGLTFGSFNQLRKISSKTLDLWASVLHALPNASLRLKATALEDTGTRAKLLERLAAREVASDRITIAPIVASIGDHLAAYRDVDIALDTFPYHGTTTTCEALWMGVPVVTLAGREHRSRVGVSLLRNVGLPELVAETPADFVRVAVALAQYPARRAELRAGLRDQMERSPLMDAPGFTRAFEGALRDMWRAWCVEAEPRENQGPTDKK